MVTKANEVASFRCTREILNQQLCQEDCQEYIEKQDQVECSKNCKPFYEKVKKCQENVIEGYIGSGFN